jgi:hypothetical protein
MEMADCYWFEELVIRVLSGENANWVEQPRNLAAFHSTLTSLRTNTVLSETAFGWCN